MIAQAILLLWAVLVGVMAAFVGVMAWLVLRLQRERDDAEREASLLRDQLRERIRVITWVEIEVRLDVVLGPRPTGAEPRPPPAPTSDL